MLTFVSMNKRYIDSFLFFRLRSPRGEILILVGFPYNLPFRCLYIISFTSLLYTFIPQLGFC